MPIHSIGYRAWDSSPSAAGGRSLVVAVTGIQRAAKSRWLRRMLFLAIVPPLFFSAPFFIFEQAMRDPNLAQEFLGFVRGMPQSEVLGDVMVFAADEASPDQVHELRHRIWSYLLLTLFRYPQSLGMVLVVGIVAPPLISHDIRSRAFLIYFSKPLSRWEYVLGKTGTVTFFLLMITTVPALALYAAAVMLSPSLAVLLATWDLPLRILLASCVLILPTTAMALMFSSMTTESRYAAFAWFSAWILGHVTFTVVMAFSAGVVDGVTLAEPGWRALLSPYHALGTVQAWIFGLSTNPSAVGPAMVLLAAIVAISFSVIFYRVSAPMRA